MNLLQFERYRTNDKDMDALCLMRAPSARSTCIRHHHPPKQHLSSNISRRNNIQYFLIQLKIPEEGKAINYQIGGCIMQTREVEPHVELLWMVGWISQKFPIYSRALLLMWETTWKLSSLLRIASTSSELTTYFSKTAFAKNSQKVKIFYIIFSKTWNHCRWRC